MALHLLWVQGLSLAMQYILEAEPS